MAGYISRITLIGLLVLAVGAGAGVVTADSTGEAAAAAQDTSGSIEGVTVLTAVDADGNTTYVWLRADGEVIQTYQVEIEVASAGPNTEICLNDTCHPVGNRTTVVVTQVEAPEDGSIDTSVVLRNASSGTEVDTEPIRLQPITREGDLDGDEVSNGREAAIGTNITQPDTDGDGLGERAELERGTDPTLADTDGDGLQDGDELRYGTHPLNADTDGDGLQDGDELDHGANPLESDTDGDGLLDRTEIERGTDPFHADTDGDGLSDAEELEHETDPTRVDTDGDDFTDAKELEYGTDPLEADTDGDGLSDTDELQYGTNPISADTDGDGLNDSDELEQGTDLLNADTDGDGLEDDEELGFGTDPIRADSDGDFLSDGVEHQLGTNPTSPVTPAWVFAVLFGFLGGIGVSLTAINRGWIIAINRALEPYTYRLPFVGPTTIEIDDPKPSPGNDDAIANSPTIESDGDRNPSPNGDDVTADSAAEVLDQFETELVSDRDLVERMLRAEGDKMKQGAIVEATDWSKAKVSRLLSSMADDDDIVKVSLGRENLICLAGTAPEIVRPTTGDRAGLVGSGTNRTSGQ